MTGTTKRNSPNTGGGPYPYQTSAGKWWHFVATVTLPDGTRRKAHMARVHHQRGSAQGHARAALGLRPVRRPVEAALGAYLADWLDGLRLAPSTVASYRKSVRLHIDPYLGTEPLAQLAPAKLTELYRDLEKSGRAASPACRRGPSGTCTPS